MSTGIPKYLKPVKSKKPPTMAYPTYKDRFQHKFYLQR